MLEVLPIDAVLPELLAKLGESAGGSKCHAKNTRQTTEGRATRRITRAESKRRVCGKRRSRSADEDTERDKATDCPTLDEFNFVRQNWHPGCGHHSVLGDLLRVIGCDLPFDHDACFKNLPSFLRILRGSSAVRR
jgi:hypothetical protein